MLIVHQVKCRVSHSNEDVVAALCKKCHIKKDQITHMEILRRSLDARKKPDLFYLYTVLLELRSGEAAVLKACAKDRDVQQTNDPGFQASFLPEIRTVKTSGKRPVIIGSGPAGLFCAWELTMAGLNPVVLERGKKIEERTADVERFWKDGVLDPTSNVQFGEGGAGTFSDGKLNTL
ncbi:MAG: NAD(P)-binding protein, partial [Lachnospiraceae bacterium]|nr:NAD(P)-binding protein [Lachnospiraceae bacterium]